jgi:hypothetical protein
MMDVLRLLAGLAEVVLLWAAVCAGFAVIVWAAFWSVSRIMPLVGRRHRR